MQPEAPAGRPVSARTRRGPGRRGRPGRPLRFNRRPGKGTGDYTCTAPNASAGGPPGPHVALLLSDPAAPAILEPRRREGGKAGGRSHPPLTGLSHPGDAEAGEAEEHDSDEREQQVHALDPHGAGRVGQRAERRVEATSSAHTHVAEGERHGACAPRRAPCAPSARCRRAPCTAAALRELPALGELLRPRSCAHGSALRIQAAC